MISSEELKKFDALGLIPGPEEAEEEFKQRATYCLNLHKELEVNGLEFPPPANEELTKPILEESFEQTAQLFGIRPSWVPIVFNNERLSLWHAACAWIFQWKGDTPVSALLQLRTNWLKKKSLLGIYQRKEVVAHELAHVGRMAFHEPIFEEFFAFETSSSQFQKRFGPVIQSSIESMGFFLLLFLLFLCDIFSIALGYEKLFYSAQWLKLIPLGLILAGLVRLWRRWNILNRAKKKLREFVKSPELLSSTIYRLTDEEIISFSRRKKESISAYVKQQNSLRWTLLKIKFLKNTPS